MSTSTSVFPFAHIALTAAITAGVALLVLVVLRTRFKALSLVDGLLVAVVVGHAAHRVEIGRQYWGDSTTIPCQRSRPNDVLCPLVTYLFIGFYAAFRRPADAMRFEQTRVLLTLVSFVGSAGHDLARKSTTMTHKLILRRYIDLPFHPEGDFDHGDVALSDGSVFIANTAAGTVEVVDGEHLRHLVTIPDCPEASGVLAAQEEGLVFAAARGVGKLPVIDAVFTNVLREVAVGSRPNGLAWDPRRKHLLVADVQDNTARLVDPQAGQVIAAVSLPGRPRWAVYHESGDRFLVNMREPAVVVVLSAKSFELVGQFPVSGVGPHGLDLDQEGHRAFIACDGGTVVTVDTSKGLELAQVPISGTPDAIWHNHRLSRLYVAIQDPGVIDVVNTETMTVEEQIQTEVGTHTTAFDSRRQRLYVFLPSCCVVMYEESETG